MDSVRQALGDDQINYLGYSYGTELGAAYVERFGDHVRSMVLDGAIDPSIGPIDELVNQEAGFQTAFNDYAADCARSTDCPLGTDPAQWVVRHHQLIDPLLTKPPATSEGHVAATSALPAAAPVAPGKVGVVSTTHGPATPYQAGVDLAHQLGADLITFEGTQHTVTFSGNDCVDGAVVRYLVDGAAPGNLRC